MEIKAFGFTPILGWSFSRYDTFSDCKRRYYYQYYGKYDPQYKRDKIDFLKGLTSIPMEIGIISHDVIQSVLERLLKSTAPIDTEKLEGYLQEMNGVYWNVISINSQSTHLNQSYFCILISKKLYTTTLSITIIPP